MKVTQKQTDLIRLIETIVLLDLKVPRSDKNLRREIDHLSSTLIDYFMHA